MTVALSKRASDVRVIALISLAHGSSHFFHLILPPMFPWLKDAFALNYAELGLLMSIFFVVSCMAQAGSGFLVDRIGARPVLFSGISLLILAALIYSQSNGYFMLLVGAVIAGCGNGIFHPVESLCSFISDIVNALMNARTNIAVNIAEKSHYISTLRIKSILLFLNLIFVHQSSIHTN